MRREYGTSETFHNTLGALSLPIENLEQTQEHAWIAGMRADCGMVRHISQGIYDHPEIVEVGMPRRSQPPSYRSDSANVLK